MSNLWTDWVTWALLGEVLATMAVSVFIMLTEGH